MSERFEFSRPIEHLEAQPDGTVLPKRRMLVRRERPDRTWEDVGWVSVRLVQVLAPPPGHAPVAVRVEMSLSLAAVASTWDGVDRRQHEP